ncbi:acyl-CoA thioesterase [Chondromyces crocatus]|uniref:Acyl-CoA thioesterase n=1 Tax=Chondromyces crocatus TaxID=52 RepID=A0A0K1EQX7_CHOCO|nr:thioesterase family protein [Chondromyces crocatus]AKT43330.1 acyl-CoA thioesterase [Chondromyces crocatus]
MSIHDLEAATRPRRRDASTFDLEIQDGWQQGRGAYGGVVIASLVRAIEGFAETPDRPLRSLTVELPGPTLVGPAELRVEALRVGSGQSTFAARALQNGEVCAHAVAILAKPRAPSAATFRELTAPPLRPFDETQELPYHTGLFPTFAQHLVYRSDGPFPFSSHEEARVTGWVRPRAAGPMSRGAYLAAMADAWWPATFSRASQPFPIGTVAYTLQIVGSGEPIDPARPLAYRAHVWVQHEGYFVEQRELWTEDGELLALNQQTFAIIK